MAIGYITFVFVFSGVMAWFRAWVDGFGLSENKTVAKMSSHIAKMLGCPFCTGFWVAGAIQLVFWFDVTGRGVLGALLITWPALSLAGAFLAFAAGHAVNRLPMAVEYDQRGS